MNNGFDLSKEKLGEIPLKKVSSIAHTLYECMSKRKRLLFFGAYSFVFVLVSVLVFSWFHFTEKTFIYEGDGVPIYVNMLAYFGKELRGIVYNLLESGKIVLPMYDHSVGFGSDILAMLHGHISDPLNILAVIIPVSNTESLFVFLVVFRIYLSGLTFSIYCRYMRKPKFATICGALVYAFCGLSIWTSVRHPLLMNSMIYLPLFLVGVEKVFAKQRPYLLIVVVAVSAINNVYSCYMLSILLIVYTAIRFFTQFREIPIRIIIKCIGKAILYYAIGLLIACAVFVPAVMSLLSTSRVDTQHNVGLFYNLGYYFRFFPSFISSITPGGVSTLMGYAPVALVAVAMLFTKKKKEYFQLKIGLILLTSFLMLPVVGHIFNVFSYPSNRWIFGFSFIVAFILVTMIPDIINPTKRQLRSVSAFSIAYFSVSLLIRENRFQEFLVANALLLFTIVFMYGFYIHNIEFQSENILLENHMSKRGKSDSSFPRLIILTLIIVSISFHAYYLYSPTQRNYVNDFVKPGEALDRIINNPSSPIRNLGDESYFRFDTNRSRWNTPINFSILNRQNSTDIFLSAVDGNISRHFLSDLSIPLWLEFFISGFDSRTMPSVLSSVKYYVVRPGFERDLPYGYTEVVYSDMGYAVYMNDYYLPLGYTYDAIIPEALYNSLAPAEKQQALLQGANIGDVSTENPKLNNIDQIIPSFNHKVIPSDIECGPGIVYDDGVFTVTNTSSRVILSFDGLEECETYLGLYNIHFDEMHIIETYSEEAWERLSLWDRVELKRSYYLWTDAGISNITIRTGDVAKTVNLRNPNHLYYLNQHDFLTNLGFNAQAIDRIEIQFQRRGTYSLDGIEVICQPMDKFEEQVSKLGEETLENVEISTNFVTGTISTSKDKILCISIPYSKGWRAYVNGNQTELLNINTMYSGVYLPDGDHEVMLKYTTPYLIQGGVLSIIGILAFSAVIVSIERRKRINVTH